MGVRGMRLKMILENKYYSLAAIIVATNLITALTMQLWLTPSANARFITMEQCGIDRLLLKETECKPGIVSQVKFSTGASRVCTPEKVLQKLVEKYR